MSENPFTSKPAPANQTGYTLLEAQRGFSRLGKVMLLVVTVTAICFLVGWYYALERQHQLEAFGPKLTAAQNALDAARADNSSLQARLTAALNQVADLEQEKAMTSQMAKGLEDEMRSAMESKDVTISNLQGKLTVSILDRVLFDSGEAELKPAGQTVMRQMAALLAQHPNLKIQVNGHTDNIPIKPDARGKFASNWELSAARALAAVHFLTERAGVDPRRVSAAGYGEFRPLADNATAEGRAKNRRIAIVILPDEMAVADVPGAIEPARK